MSTPLALRLGAGLFAATLCAGAASAQQCPGALPASDFCTSARVLGGSPGAQFLVINPSAATAPGESICGVPVGHTTWLSMVPSVSGILTLTTCHPSTSYDTVAEAFVGGDSFCEFMTPVACNDDTPTGECANGCSAYGSTLRFSVTAGQSYRFRIGSYNNNSAGCNLCLGVIASLCDGETTPPDVTISSPTALQCVCPGVYYISGTVSDTGSGVMAYTLDYASVANPAWTLIGKGLGNVTGTLAQWNTTGFPEDDYYIRLTARDGCGNVASTITTCRINAGVDSFLLRSPTSGAILGGYVVADGTAYDRCAPGTLSVEWAPLGGAYSPFNVGPPWVINDPLGSWNTRAGVPDGNYSVRATARTPCQSQLQTAVNVVIDNTPPIAVITSPATCTNQLPGLMPIRGTVNDAHLASWILQYTGGDSAGWVTISSGTSPVINGVLGTWDTRPLRHCQYTLRLVATDAAILDSNSAIHNQAESLVSFHLGTDCTQDYNADGVVNSQDFFDFLTIFFGGCP